MYNLVLCRCCYCTAAIAVFFVLVLQFFCFSFFLYFHFFRAFACLSVGAFLFFVHEGLEWAFCEDLGLSVWQNAWLLGCSLVRVCLCVLFLGVRRGVG